MNETLHDQGPAPQPGAPQSSRTAPHQDLDRLRRSTSNRYLAGVAGGLGRHFGIDPTIIRVLLVVLTFFGGAGLLVYGACWLFVPEDGAQHAVVHVGSEPRKILLLAAAGIAFLLAAGDAFSGFDGGWVIASLAVLLAIGLVARDRRGASGAPTGTPTPTPTPTATPTATPSATGWTAGAANPPATSPAVEPTQVLDAGDQPTAQPTAQSLAQPSWQPPAWQPPVGRPPLVPPAPRRTGIVWFWPTLALIAIGLGVLAILDQGSTDVPAAAYPALALAITGVMLLVGSVVGRPGGLVLLGVLSTLALSVATVVGDFHWDARTIDERPVSAAQVEPTYTAHNGSIDLDLTQVADPASLAGRTLDLSLNAGEITVYVPRGLNVDIDAQIGFAGGITVPGYDGGGIQDSVVRHLRSPEAGATAPLDLELDVRLGQITVEVR